ncbi:N-acetylglucosaminyldiphosphoundecaprenol N-acetyl-beta-D-mannosaminyltransferase [Planomicrobium stackebrandtii]|uniref:N-acetylglucosaminyldiphosphoundecaprenol N-acetyl-beta-D-mannosaminyltransferase n=1 Tax=Planomicrobium stackebrandtii TaxID=253160 RepID=A0ABU0GSM1_9BACL|nr:WecB/TagA/CpsF family glycosyltransferase [Planomicrobium stackebrandtii]MDQ0428356.1 N-acetylglucosaminyldiphosphoundecaprenol N-acetyl-beta-D-mannosaminyltransferase [Planomicrobium stackebrandtii]
MTSKFVHILGVPFVNTSQKDFISTLQSRIAKQEKTFVVTANPEIVMHSLEDDQYKQTLAKAQYITADGIGIVKAAAIIGKPLPERVSGYDLMLDLLETADKNRSSVFFLGAAEEVLQATVKKAKQNYPGIQIAGSHNGFFDWNDHVLTQQIKNAAPDIVFVALGFPRQEQWIGANIDKFDKGVFIGIGGSFDVFSGTVKRAPELWQKMNLEWFYRLVKQPSRWKRMLVLPKFAATVIGRKALRK